MLQALVMEGVDPNMVMLQEVLEVSGWLRGQGHWNPVSSGSADGGEHQ